MYNPPKWPLATETDQQKLPALPVKKYRPIAVVVDDEDDFRYIIKRVLESFEYQVRDFKDCVEAIEYFKDIENAQRVNLVVSDLMMENGDGIDLLSVLNKNPLLDHIKFYLITGADPSVFKDLLAPYQIEQVIEKPFDMRKVQEIFRKAG